MSVNEMSWPGGSDLFLLRARYNAIGRGGPRCHASLCVRGAAPGTFARPLLRVSVAYARSRSVPTIISSKECGDGPRGVSRARKRDGPVFVSGEHVASIAADV